MISGASDEELDIAIARANVLLELQPKIDELKKENQELKKQLEVGKQQYNDLVEEKEKLQEQLSSNTLQFEKWLESEIKACELTCDLIFNHNKEMKIYKEILSKYKEITGGKE